MNIPHLSAHKRLFGVALIVGILIVVAALAVAPRYRAARAEARFASYVAAHPGFSDQLVAYRELMRSVGAERAQVILTSMFSDNSRSHMMDHQTGKFLYETQGFSGIRDCKKDFAGGCYHGFISAAIADNGLSDFKEIVTECLNALSDDQIMQCSHGVGHGLLAEVAGFEHLPEALALCENFFAGDEMSVVNCYDGVFMENNFGEFNVPPPERWFKASDPMYPCEIPEVLARPGAHKYCWGMQSQMTLNAAAYPQFAGNVAKVGAYCDKLSAEDKRICLEGIARQIQLSHADDHERIRAECGTLRPEQAPVCVAQAAEAAYIYGSRSSETLNICKDETGTRKDTCYEVLFEGFGISYSATSTRLAACARDVVESEYRAKCVAWMNSPAAFEF